MFPVGDSPKSRTRPWANYLLIAINVGVFIYMLTLQANLSLPINVFNELRLEAAQGVCYGLLTVPTELELFVCEFGFQPREFFDIAARDPAVASPDRPTILATVITAQFIHAGWLHIGGNMLFLFVFGDMIEDRFGHLRYLLFYLTAGIVATITQGLIDPDSLIPVIGASGAVAGVLGAYLYLYPRATVYVVIPFLFLIFIPLPVPAFIMIGVWFLQNLLSGFAVLSDTADPTAGIAWFAHIGGFLFGLLLAYMVGKPKRKYRR